MGDFKVQKKAMLDQGFWLKTKNAYGGNCLDVMQPNSGTVFVCGCRIDTGDAFTNELQLWANAIFEYEKLKGEIPAVEPAPTRWIEEVKQVVDEREGQYAHPLINFLRIAENEMAVNGDLYAGTTKVYTPLHVARTAYAWKLGREVDSFKVDSYLDIIGYTDCIDRINQAMVALGYEKGAAWFRTCTFTEQHELRQRLETDAVAIGIMNGSSKTK